MKCATYSRSSCVFVLKIFCGKYSNWLWDKYLKQTIVYCINIFIINYKHGLDERRTCHIYELDKTTLLLLWSMKTTCSIDGSLKVKEKGQRYLCFHYYSIYDSPHLSL